VTTPDAIRTALRATLRDAAVVNVGISVDPADVPHRRAINVSYRVADIAPDVPDDYEQGVCGVCHEPIWLSKASGVKFRDEGADLICTVCLEAL